MSQNKLDLAAIIPQSPSAKDRELKQNTSLKAPLYSPTPRISEGPFYQEGAPFRNQLSDNPTLFLSGKVLNIYGEIVPGAILEIWQADEIGRYDVKEFKMRCKIQVNDQGEYELKTIRPGHYAVATDMIRCAHIHVKVSAPEYTTLSTQLYFPASKYNETDMLFQSDTVLSGENGQYQFNFVLEIQEQKPAQDLSQDVLGAEKKFEDQFPLDKYFISPQEKDNTSTGPSTSNLYSPTPNILEDYFYKEDAPFRNQLADNPTICISGRVLDPDGNVIQNAVLDVWQANELGMFDVEGYEFRGKTKTDDKGRYQIKTVRPGNYLVSAKVTRCAYIQVKLSAPEFRGVSTQLFFEDDGYNQTDEFFTPQTVIGVGNIFDFVLEKE